MHSLLACIPSRALPCNAHIPSMHRIGRQEQRRTHSLLPHHPLSCREREGERERVSERGKGERGRKDLPNILSACLSAGSLFPSCLLSSCSSLSSRCVLCLAPGNIRSNFVCRSIVVRLDILPPVSVKDRREQGAVRERRMAVCCAKGKKEVLSCLVSLSLSPCVRRPSLCL